MVVDFVTSGSEGAHDPECDCRAAEAPVQGRLLRDQPLLAPDRIGTDGAGPHPPAIAAARKEGLLPQDPLHYVTKHLQQGSRATTSGSRGRCRGSAAFSPSTQPGGPFGAEVRGHAVATKGL